MFNQSKSHNSISPDNKTKIGGSEKSNGSIFEVDVIDTYQDDDNFSVFEKNARITDSIKASYNFIFEGKNSQELICKVFSKNGSPLRRALINSILDFLETNNMLSENNDIELTIKMSECIISFVHNDDKNFIEPVIKFITWLGDLGLLESYQNPFSLWFYASNGGDQILNFTNYPSGLRIFLDQERINVDRLLKKNIEKYTTLIEVGCGSMENIALASSNNLNYHGLDFSAACILVAQKIIKKDNIKNASAQYLNIVNFDKEDLLIKSEERPVFFFPFNLLGNIAPISKLISKFKKFGFDMIFSIYKIDEEINNIRLNYYSNCGYNNIEKEENNHGVVFKSDEGLYTIAYKNGYLENLIKSFGFNVITLESSYGIILYASIILADMSLVKVSSSFSNDMQSTYLRQESTDLFSPIDSSERTISPTGEELYQQGLVSEKAGDKKGAYAFFERSCLKGFFKAYTSVGLHKIDIGSEYCDKKTGIAYLEHAADLGHARAMSNLGRAFEKGDADNGFCNEQKALEWYKKAFEVEPTEHLKKKIDFITEKLNTESNYQYNSGSISFNPA